MASVDIQLAQLQGQLNDLAKSMQLAQASGQLVALAAFKVQFRELSAQAATLRGKANASDAPGLFVRAFTAFSNQAITVGKAIGEPVGDLLGSASTIFKMLPFLVLLVVAGAVWWAVKGGVKVGVGR